VGAFSRLGPRAWVGVLVCLLASLPAPALGQQQIAPPPLIVRGVLIDAVSGLRVPRGEVLLTDGSAQTLADSAGVFTLRGVPAGARVLHADAFGYQGVLLSIIVTDTLGVLEIELEPDPIAIEGLDVNPSGPVTVWGVVVDARSGAAIPNTSVWLRGSFRLTRIREGRDLMLVTKLGYLGQYVPVRAQPSSDPVEVRLEPDSVVLAGVAVVARNLKSRRNAFPQIVREYRQDRIVRSGSSDVATFLRTWGSLQIFPCERQGQPGDQCTIGRRGQPTVIRVFVNEMPVPAGMDILNTYPPHEVYAVEVFGRNMIRLYTNTFMEQIARRPRLLLGDDIPTGTALR
jgi:hypothetical protein